MIQIAASQWLRGTRFSVSYLLSPIGNIRNGTVETHRAVGVTERQNRLMPGPDGGLRSQVEQQRFRLGLLIGSHGEALVLLVGADKHLKQVHTRTENTFENEYNRRCAKTTGAIKNYTSITPMKYETISGGIVQETLNVKR